MNQASHSGSTTRVMGDILSAAAVVIALLNNHTYQWAIGVPIVLAVVGMGLRIEAVLAPAAVQPEHAPVGADSRRSR